MDLDVRSESWELEKPFTIARGTFRFARVVVVEIRDGDHRGRGEAAAIDYHGESIESIIEQIENAWKAAGGRLDRSSLQQILPAGGARNALDCALWDLEAKRVPTSIWNLVRIQPQDLVTVCTLGIDTPAAMAANAAGLRRYPILKVKLNDDNPVERIEAIRGARPDARLIVDANQAWTLSRLAEVAPALADLGVEMIEQPLPEGHDQELLDYRAPLPLCADESCNTTADLDSIRGRYQMVNIKLDKTGGLTEALQLARSAQAGGLEVMVGNMLGSSLAMAPAFLLGQLCRYHDLDGPLLQKADREHAMIYDGATVSAPVPELWG